MSRDFLASQNGREFKPSPNRDRIIRIQSRFAIKQITAIKFAFVSRRFFQSHIYTHTGRPKFYRKADYEYTNTFLYPTIRINNQSVMLGQEPTIGASSAGQYSLAANIPRFTPTVVGQKPNFAEYVNVLDVQDDFLDIKVAENPDPANQYRLKARYTEEIDPAELYARVRTKLDNLEFPAANRFRQYRNDGSTDSEIEIERYNLSSGIESTIGSTLSIDRLFPSPTDTGDTNRIRLHYLGFVLRDVLTQGGTVKLWRFIAGQYGTNSASVKFGADYDPRQITEVSCQTSTIGTTLQAPTFDDLKEKIPNVWNLSEPNYILAQYAFPPNILQPSQTGSPFQYFSQNPSCL